MVESLESRVESQSPKAEGRSPICNLHFAICILQSTIPQPLAPSPQPPRRGHRIVGESLRDSHGMSWRRGRAGSGSRRGGTTTRHPRLGETRPRGISLTEVLISLGILAVGLLGVAAVFPVGSFYMQKATISDNGSAIAQSVMNDLVARGTVNPKAWYAMVPTPPATNAAQFYFPNYYFSGIDGKYALVSPTPTNTTSTFTRPFAEALAQSTKVNSDPVILSRQFGNAYIIDPLYVAATGQRSVSIANTVAYPFPASAVRSFPRNTASWPYYEDTAWNPWRIGNANDRVWPIRRVTLQDASGWPMSAEMASHYFRGSDDLTTDLPSRADRPARQNWDMADLDNDGFMDASLARQRVGDYSWIVSVVPTTNAARDALAGNPEGYSYDVSVVVFFKRLLPSRSSVPTPDTQTINEAATFERAVSASIVSTGPNGGELLLQAIDTLPGSPFEHLKTGQWIMLCGPHPNSNVADNTVTPPKGGEPRFVVKWYQVLSIEKEQSQLLIDPKLQRLVTVRGPEWPWQPAANQGQSFGGLSNDLCVGIFRGAVAVHTKTMRLESVRGGAGMGLVAGPGLPQPPIVPY